MSQVVYRFPEMAQFFFHKVNSGGAGREDTLGYSDQQKRADRRFCVATTTEKEPCKNPWKIASSSDMYTTP